MVVPTGVAQAKTLIDYFLPTPVIKQTTSNAWGSTGVLPRDQDNGVEDKTNKSWSYWDGKILRAKDGKYHMYASRWSQSAGHNGWFGSVCVHTVSDSSPLGPYVDKGLCYNDQNGKGHNVMVEQMNDGTYFVLVSETRRPATVYTSKSLDGPWVAKGSISFQANGFNIDVGNGSQLHSNTVILPRPDGSFLSIAREGVVSLSTSGILGPYKVMTKSVFPNVQGLNNGFAEDPVIWRSGNKYHITVNWWDAKQARHVMSDDGINNWKDMGVAYIPSRDFIKYSNGVVNHWTKIERPQVYLENGHVTHFTFSVIDVEKDKDGGNDNHNSKVIVVPFDGLQFDKDNGWVSDADPIAPHRPQGIAVVRQDGGWAVRLAGFGSEPVDLEVRDLDGRVAMRRSLAPSSAGTVSWPELDRLPSGTWFVGASTANGTREISAFTRF
ncbi:MAG TPA: glycoside hydrolase family protein [Fibrobacteria bacterium]|nr:glycoside hydrolase family protein [Fibrobacteria bacterium]